MTTRDSTGTVRWTDPTGRTWTSPPQHTPPARAVRALPPLPSAEPHHLSPDALLELLADPDDDPNRYELRAPDTDPDNPQHDPLARRIEQDTGWGLALDDPYRWVACSTPSVARRHAPTSGLPIRGADRAGVGSR